MSAPGRHPSALLGLAALGVALASACTLASGWDPKSSPPPVVASADPDTQPLPAGSHWTVPDPKAPPPPPAPAAPEPVAHDEDAGAGASADAAVVAAHKPGAPAKPTGPAKPVAPAKPAAEADCGTGGKPCPMQAFMRGTMAGAKTPEAMAAAFARVARMSPNGGWSWAAIAKKGADLAKAGDVKGAKGQCAACHSAYKAPYKAQYRGRKI
ncbi:MAG: hypothetical protein KC657_07525 [Myxococcales bacterium]|nr:hypothetical protein [Myxococcales bacterium]